MGGEQQEGCEDDSEEDENEGDNGKPTRYGEEEHVKVMRTMIMTRRKIKEDK